MYVYRRWIAHERELSKEALKCEEIMERIEETQVMKTMTILNPFYPQLMKEFIVNIPKEFNKVGSYVGCLCAYSMFFV